MLPRAHVSKVEELWSLDAESLRVMAPVHGLVFLFKWTAEPDPRPVLNETEGKMFFARQVRAGWAAMAYVGKCEEKAHSRHDNMPRYLPLTPDLSGCVSHLTPHNPHNP